ncbi:DUF1963 domain-containing protein [Sphingopyxis sp. RIFCSPHIGHO2_12_FULL_65_19]|uniref:DUF1963 domain-containing protein n=1 Tax=Sphingopyxis sp. RIFCSPHIGHO2_12_FULL_65_19 TaxID=1802172 RepID=UPI0008CA859C|nr:DUF1963 domain-containing protein [Sphingopyxis sp. RIFCSPHIGHO2_12_FULL_65_19]OHD07088.1 MAG: hypothetical protein A3E77_15190 [Sphingopyxis sp. RIFCSPHIGHO2_12_FULL_65_19]
MNQLESAALKLVLFTLAFLAIIFALWWRRRPRTVPAAPRAPGEFRLPRLSRKAQAEPDDVEIAPARLARVSGKAPLQQDARAIEWDDAPIPVATEAETALESHIADVERQVVRLEKPEAEVAARPAGSEKPETGAVTLRIVPQVPPRDPISTTSWLGGRPRLPAGTEWPRIDDQPADFLAQIDCASLPGALWDGLGPRDGMLALFIHRRKADVRVLHVRDAGTPIAPPFALNDPEGWFGPLGGLGEGELAPFAVRAFPEWPVDLVAVHAEGDDPRDTGDAGETARALFERGYDIADPAFHPFDWGSMTAMVALLEARLGALAGTDAPSADDGETDEAKRRAAINREAAERAREIIGIVHDSAARDAFSAGDATAVMAALHAIRWASMVSTVDPETGTERTDMITLPLTTHRADANLWVHDYQTMLFDRAKHAWCANPDHLSAPARAFYEPWWQQLAAREMAAMGHKPFRPVADYDADRDAVLIELPTSGLMSRRFGDGANLVITAAKADLAIGDFSRVRAQISR